MPNLKSEVSRQLAVTAAIVGTTNTIGWQYIKELADKVVSTAVQDSLDEEDSTLGESKRLKAKALQKGFNQLFTYLDSLKTYNPEVEDDNDFAALDIELNTVTQN